ncbi:Isoprenylcysteine carboxyl methyltransferase family-domain-containing protein [Cyathus striatus]|nr:Isoprenylcysteine carboxyl methyltransferase family-domain-containing protein [Cyathus striatus]
MSRQPFVPSSDDALETRFQQRAAMQSSHPLSTTPVIKPPHGHIPNTPLASSTIAFLLGSTFALGFLTFLVGGFSSTWWSTYQLGFFVASWALFHWAEFAVTAGWNLEKCSVDSYLLDNGAMYHIANGTALAEYLITLFFKQEYKKIPYVSQIGILLVVFGQSLRSIAMIHASTNFSHAVAFNKRDSHNLVTDGVYRWFRHPSYAGFFYWALGTQLVLQNPISLILFVVLLWRFFYYRIRVPVSGEEHALVKFFGQAYVEYRAHVGTKIPFIP